MNLPPRLIVRKNIQLLPPEIDPHFNEMASSPEREVVAILKNVVNVLQGMAKTGLPQATILVATPEIGDPPVQRVRGDPEDTDICPNILLIGKVAQPGRCKSKIVPFHLVNHARREGPRVVETQ